MNKKKIAFIAVTALLCVGLLPGAVLDITQPEMVKEVVSKLGLPLSLLTLIGVWKLLGIVGLALPAKYRRINEWAYAGFFFDLSGAVYVHTVADDMAGGIPALLFLVLLLVSYRLRPALNEDAAETTAKPSPAGAEMAAATG